ncbi:MAG: C69 family dipeptidase [Blastocatellia bacterium]
MCDTLVAVPPNTADGAVWFAKNSDREPGEAQLIEHLPRKSYGSPTNLRCTYLEMAQAGETFEVLISRPFWMWGAEMGVNEHGLAIGNEAVFTRVTCDKSGLTGMDLLRLALERTASARDALDLITGLIKEHGQGGSCGYRNKGFRYHNSYIIADPSEAWVLETAGPHWAAQRVRGVRTISNVLSIGKDFDLLSDEAYSFARSKNWCRSTTDFDFARCFADSFYTAMSGGATRAACTSTRLHARDGSLAREDFFGALRDHAGVDPSSGWRMKMPCAHASWWPMRHAGQTTASMVARLTGNGSLHWMTGTSSPCLSVFKPVRLGGEIFSSGPEPQAAYDSQSLFWRHEMLHRSVLADYKRRKAVFDKDRRALESKILEAADGLSGDFQSYWEEHRAIIPEWSARVEESSRPVKTSISLFKGYWKNQQKEDRIPD